MLKRKNRDAVVLRSTCLTLIQRCQTSTQATSNGQVQGIPGTQSQRRRIEQNSRRAKISWINLGQNQSVRDKAAESSQARHPCSCVDISGALLDAANACHLG